MDDPILEAIIKFYAVATAGISIQVRVPPPYTLYGKQLHMYCWRFYLLSQQPSKSLYPSLKHTFHDSPLPAL